MTRVDFDFGELERWTDVLHRAPAEVRVKGRAVVTRHTRNVKNRAQRRAPSGPHTRHYARSITDSIDQDAYEIVGEVGPQRGRPQWGLGNLLEYGSRNNRPHPHLEPALDFEDSLFIRACLDLAEGAIDG